MSTVRPNDILAICLADVHLSLRPPIARAEEPNWLEAQARPWNEIKELMGDRENIPVIIAGDLFDRWNPPVELVNWALDTLPSNLAGIPGNHDLPSHRHEGEHRSGWGTLVRARELLQLTPDGDFICRDRGYPNISPVVYGFPFKMDVTPPEIRHTSRTNIAVIHEFMWTTKDTGYHGVPKKLQLTKKDKRFNDYNLVIVGDNHIPFELKLKNRTTVINCGTLLRRKSNEAHLHPRVVLITAEGFTSHELDTSQDIITQVEPDLHTFDSSGITKLIDDLAGLQSHCLVYRDSLIAAMEHRDCPQPVQQIIMEALDG